MTTLFYRDRIRKCGKKKAKQAGYLKYVDKRYISDFFVITFHILMVLARYDLVYLSLTVLCYIDSLSMVMKSVDLKN